MRRAPRRGAATVELAFLLPLLLMLALMVIDFGRIIYTSITIDNCAHNAGIYASHCFDNQNQQWISADAQYWEGPPGASQVINTEQAALLVDGQNLSPPVDSTMVSYSPTTVDANGYVITSVYDSAGNPAAYVTITYPFSLISSSYLGLPSSFNITRTSQFRVAPTLPN
jgi:Flp pilus assembly protein TadG